MTLLASAILCWSLSTVALSATIEALTSLEFAGGGDAGGNRELKGTELLSEQISQAPLPCRAVCYALES